jgi:hypothetical protein
LVPALVSKSIDQTVMLMARVETKRKKRVARRLAQASLRNTDGTAGTHRQL